MTSAPSGPCRVDLSEGRSLLEAGFSYLDVRTPAEYAAGHPPGALNVPFLVSEGGRAVENAEFLSVVVALFPPDAKLLIGCATGQRSLAAARRLLDAGFSEVRELRPGWAGLRDPFGQVVEQGWAGAGLPTEHDTPGGSYEELRARAAGLSRE